MSARMKFSLALSRIEDTEDRYPKETSLARLDVEIDPDLGWSLFQHCVEQGGTDLGLAPKPSLPKLSDERRGTDAGELD